MKRLFNKNNLKISYKCGPNTGQHIRNHNKKILNGYKEKLEDEKKRKERGVGTNRKEEKKEECNCKRKECPVGGNCRRKSLIYKANVVEKNKDGRQVGEKKRYVGQTKNEFKLRYNQYCSDFRLESKKNKTQLSKWIWGIKERGNEWNIEWSLGEEKKVFRRDTGRCYLCLEEKIQILEEKKESLLNSRRELFVRCPHKKDCILGYQEYGSKIVEKTGKLSITFVGDEDGEIMQDLTEI